MCFEFPLADFCNLFSGLTGRQVECILERMVDDGHIKGIIFKRNALETKVGWDRPRITTAGLEYLLTDPMMKKAREAIAVADYAAGYEAIKSAWRDQK